MVEENNARASNELCFSDLEHTESAPALAVGENVVQRIANSEINVVAGNQIVYNFTYISPAEIESSEGRFGYSKSIVTLPKRIGGDTKVYQGRCYQRNMDLAIKIMDKCTESEREAKLLLNLDHENIVKVMEVGDYPGIVPQIFIAMELCPENLSDYIKNTKHSPFNFEKSFRFSKQLVTAVVYLHEKHIVHRDLKPWNILISNCGEKIKVTDMGLSRTVDIGKTATTVTHILAGSNGFKAPETYQNNATYHFSSDIFPLGINIYFIFSSGKHPFGDDPHHWVSNIKKNVRADLTQLPILEPKNMIQLVTLLSNMLEKNGRIRPTAKEVLENIFFKEAVLQSPCNDQHDLHHLQMLQNTTTSSYLTGNRLQPTGNRLSGELRNGSMETLNTFSHSFGSSVQFATQYGKAPGYQDAERMSAADLAIFHNLSDKAELCQINIKRSVLLDALENGEYLSYMCNSLADKIENQELVEMIRSLRLLRETKIAGILYRYSSYDHKIKSSILLKRMCIEQEDRLNPRILLMNVFSCKMKRIYDTLCKAFVQYLRINYVASR